MGKETLGLELKELGFGACSSAWQLCDLGRVNLSEHTSLHCNLFLGTLLWFFG